ncbi:hypothetical protein A3D77_04890 [Candidatus Gottesmanbacteria bacterium RIFCSPHIGHO2_02_FULL_39_11]|uniref:Uncharacterized protein n=1 Tax=Candidatus Gottesmanbacteria bacterium RIFCSPHIGHO2_02_FULL_39_11 TaxID=1798382 RepID=A0A1F5ZLN4_9BACT|nr:MAG: hypothetical protein A3D77_04890 [Candidatus Gottesmanbacteria bacterium RIFCSPHIGHO2_02_FULL_39_11]
MFDFIFTFLGITPLFLLKIVFLSLFFFYIIFSIILFRQTKMMIRVVEAGISPVILTVTFIHLLASIGLFLFVFFFF